MLREQAENRRFGLVLFDDPKDPSSGWAAVAGDDSPRRIGGPNELSTETVWWTNMSYEFFFSKTEAWRNPWLRHDKYLVASPADVLREWGYDPKEVSSDFVCQFVAKAFGRVMQLAFKVMREADPRLRMDAAFVGKTMREDLRRLLPPADYPKGEAAAIVKSGRAWEEFTVTSVRRERGGRWVMLRRPRLAYAVEMLRTPIPKPPFDYVGRADMKGLAADRVAWIRNHSSPCMAEVSVNKIDGDAAPIYGFGNATDKEVRTPRSWVAHPEFLVLSRLAELDVRGAYVGKDYGLIADGMQDSTRDFLTDKFSDLSWSAGVVAESLWRAAALAEEKSKAGSLKEGEERAHTSWQGAWLKAADKSSMFATGMRLTELGYPVVSYGFGWVRCMVQEEAVADLVRDGLSLGLMPQLVDVAENSFDMERTVPWGGDRRSAALAQFMLTRQKNLLWNLDMLPAMEPDQREAMLKRLIAASRGRRL